MTPNIPFEEIIARVCHEANRAYCQSIGDDSQPDWANAPQWQKESAVNGVQFHLAAHRRGVKPRAEASHEKWLEQKQNEGWQYGPVKDPERKLHPCFVPYAVLPLDQRMKDYIFGAIVQAFYEGSAEQEQVSTVSNGGQ